ncbi:MAG: hypothetical protein LUH04_01200 [Clostridium sp.]|nr:hypothetical protein [Clostridium sp.]
MKIKFTYLPTILFLCLISCQHNKEYITKIDLAESLLETHPDSALSILKSIPESLLKIDDAHRLFLVEIQAKDKSVRSIAEDTMIFCLKDKYIKKHPDQASIVYFYVGKVLEQQNNKADALIHYLDADRTVNKEDYKLNGLIKSHIGKLFMTQHNFQSAKDQFHKALHYFDKIEDFSNLIVTYNQIGNCHLIEENLDSAYLYYEKCESLLDNSDDYRDRGALINNLAVSYRISGDIDKANSFLRQALNHPQIEKQDLCRIYMNLAQVNQENKDTFDHYIHKALLLSEEIKLPILAISIYSILADQAEEQKLYTQAIEYTKNKTQAMKDHFDAIYKTSLSDLESKYHQQLLEEANMLLVIRHQRLIIGCWVVITFLLIAILYILWQKNKLQEAMNAVAENLDELQKMATRYNETEKSLRNMVLKNFNILKKIAILEKDTTVNILPAKKVIKRMNEILYGQENLDWNQLYDSMNTLHDNLFNKLKIAFPQLDETEFQICCLSVAKFSNPEIALLMNYSINTINAKKAQVRKKLGIKPMGNIKDFLHTYFGEEKNSVTICLYSIDRVPIVEIPGN